MKYPLLPLCCAYAAGVVFQVNAGLQISGWIIFLLGSLPLLSALKSRSFAQCCLLFATGGMIAWWHATYTPAEDLRNAIGPNPRLASVRGVIVQAPEERVYQYGNDSVTRTLSQVRVSHLKTGDDWKKASGVVLAINKSKLPAEYFAGQQVELEGVIKLPPIAPAPNMFDYRNYLRWQGIYYQFETDSEKQWSLWGDAVIVEPLPEQFRQWAYKVLGRGLPADSEALSLLRAMVLGWRANLSGEISTPFMQTGTMHVFAISGLHISLMAWLLMAVGRGRLLRTKTRALIVLPLLWFYTVATGFQASAVRASVMSSVFIFADLVERPGSLLNSWAAAALIILVYQPLQLFQAGFQLSFSVVLVLLLSLHWTEKMKVCITQRIIDSYLPEESVSQWQRRRARLLNSAFMLLAVTLASWIGAMPLTLYYFNLVTPSSILANLLIVPLTSVALGASAVNLLFAHVIPPLSILCNQLSWWMMELATQVAQLVAAWPLSYFYATKPTSLVLLLYFVIAFAWLLELKTSFRLKVTAFSVILFICHGSWASIENKNKTTIAILPVSGSPIFVNSPQSAADILIDCSRSRNARTFVTRYLHAQGINSIPNVAFTHGDISHVEGYTDLKSDFHFSKVFTSPVSFRSKAYKDILASIPKGQLHSTLNNSSRAGDFQVLHPPAGAKGGRADDHVVVFQAQFHSRSVLLLGDLSEKGQLELLANHPSLQADVVITSNPLEGEPLHPHLLEQIKPQLIIICSTEFPVNERVFRDLRLRLARSGIQTLYTEDEGGIHLEFQPHAMKIISARGEIETFVTN